MMMAMKVCVMCIEWHYVYLVQICIYDVYE